MKKIATLLLSLITLLITLLFSFTTRAQSTVVIAGNFQSELGCAGDWMPDCDATRLTQTSPGIWEGTFFIPAGTWEYKVTIDNSWNENYGQGGTPGGPNMIVAIGSPTFIKFTYNHFTHFVDLSFNEITVTLAGSFQSELGCPGDWMPECFNTRLTFDPVSQHWYGVFSLPAGNWEYKITHNNSWAENYGEGGTPNGANLVLNLAEAATIRFVYNPITHIITTNEVDLAVILAGDFQSELGCAGDWMPDCPNTALSYNLLQNLWQGQLTLPAGNWSFKTTINNTWNENYGEGGVAGGANMLLNIPEISRVTFTYNPITHITTYAVTPETVVLVGSFQSELGCTSQSFNGDWEPACDITRLTYDAANRVWKGTFDIAAGEWWYKVALNNSWDENYGEGGVRGGPDIYLSLTTAANITFIYEPNGHVIELVYNKTGICANAFYDANVNGYNDENIPIKGIPFELTGDNTGTQTSGNDGNACFTNLLPGEYTITGTILSPYLATTPTTQSTYLKAPQTMLFGMVCLGGAGAQDKGFWTNKQGKAVWNSHWNKDLILQNMYYLNLRNADGSHFWPKTYNELSAWLKRANAKNMAYMTSAQLAALYLSVETELVQYDRIVHTPGMGYIGTNQDFMYVYSLIWHVAYTLYNYPVVNGSNSFRQEMERLKDLLEKANNDLIFVQQQPCGTNNTSAAKRQPQITTEKVPLQAYIWPNPSQTHFNLRPVDTGKDATVQIRVMDVNGKLVYTATGSSQQAYRFGENFRPGLYLVEVTQGSSRTTLKVIKQ